MRRCLPIKLLVALAVLSVAPLPGLANDTAPSKPEAAADPAPCLAAVAASDDDRIVAGCAALILNEKNAPADRIRALNARAAMFDRKTQYGAAIADYSAALKLDPVSADLYNRRGELYRRNGDRPHALQDFAAAIKLDPQHSVARGNYKSLAQELERLGAIMAVNNKPSFNCATARLAVEKVICADPELANLDRKINAVHTRIMLGANKDSPRAGNEFKREQQAFIDQRNASFGRADYDLRKAMNARLDHLLAIESY